MRTILVVVFVMAGMAYTALRIVREEKASESDRKMFIAYFLSLSAWALFTSLLAIRNFYVDTSRLFTMDLGTFVPFAITGGFLTNKKARRSLTEWIVNVPLRQLTWVHVIRVAAIGAILKMWKGLMPAHFIVPVGIPDFLFGLSVPLMVWLVFKKRVIGKGVLIAWNAIGALLFFPSMVLLYLSMPGPIQVFTDGPSTLEVFQFPMALVPTFLAPLFITIHSAAVYQLSRSPANSGEELLMEGRYIMNTKKETKESEPPPKPSWFKKGRSRI